MARAFLGDAEFVASHIVVPGASGYLMQFGDGARVILFFDQRYTEVASRKQIARIGRKNRSQDGDGCVVSFLFHAIECVFIAQEFGQAVFGVGRGLSR